MRSIFTVDLAFRKSLPLVAGLVAEQWYVFRSPSWAFLRRRYRRGKVDNNVGAVRSQARLIHTAFSTNDFHVHTIRTRVFPFFLFFFISFSLSLYRVEVKAFHVRAGTSRYYEGGDIYGVQSVVIHPAFNAINYDYDVGLVEVIHSRLSRYCTCHRYLVTATSVKILSKRTLKAENVSKGVINNRFVTSKISFFTSLIFLLKMKLRIGCNVHFAVSYLRS